MRTDKNITHKLKGRREFFVRHTAGHGSHPAALFLAGGKMKNRLLDFLAWTFIIMAGGYMTCLFLLYMTGGIE